MRMYVWKWTRRETEQQRHKNKWNKYSARVCSPIHSFIHSSWDFLVKSLVKWPNEAKNWINFRYILIWHFRTVNVYVCCTLNFRGWTHVSGFGLRQTILFTTTYERPMFSSFVLRFATNFNALHWNPFESLSFHSHEYVRECTRIRFMWNAFEFRNAIKKGHPNERRLKFCEWNTGCQHFDPRHVLISIVNWAVYIHYYDRQIQCWHYHFEKEIQLKWNKLKVLTVPSLGFRCVVFIKMSFIEWVIHVFTNGTEQYFSTR